MSAGVYQNALEGGLRDPVFDEFQRTVSTQASGSPVDALDTKIEVMDFLTKKDPSAEKKGWILENVLSAAECKALISTTEAVGYQDAKEYCFLYATRKNDRMMCDDDQLAAFIWERVKPHIPEKLTFGTGHDWHAYGLNKRFRICRYYEGGHFGIHTDGTFAYNSDDRSFLTCMLYLNDGGGKDFTGGTTDFYDTYRSDKCQYQLVPKTGLCVVFKQQDSDCLHGGDKLESGAKYILRTDVMFRRIATTATGQ